MSLRFENVCKSFGSKVVLRDFSFEVSKGEILFILGRSGMGKSVTLKHIVGVLKPDSGRVFVEEDEVSKMGPMDLPKVRAKCGMVFQHPALLDSLTVFENIVFGLKTPQYLSTQGKAHTENDLKKIALEKLSLVHLPGDVLYRFPSELSYGMQKRVSLARTIAPGPQYLLFDEPTTGLDPITTNAVNDLIFDLSRTLSVTSIVVSHDMNCALKIADRILVLESAQILELGSVQQVVHSKKELVQEFLQETLGLLSPEEKLKMGFKEQLK